MMSHVSYLKRVSYDTPCIVPTYPPSLGQVAGRSLRNVPAIFIKFLFWSKTVLRYVHYYDTKSSMPSKPPSPLSLIPPPLVDEGVVVKIDDVSSHKGGRIILFS